MPASNAQAYSSMYMMEKVPSSDLDVFNGIISSYAELKNPALLSNHNRYRYFRMMLGDGNVYGAVKNKWDMLRSAKYHIELADDSPESQLVGAWVGSVLTDMSHSLDETLSQMFWNIIVDGYTVHYPRYKVRKGQGELEETSDLFTSKYHDMHIGIESFIPVSTRSILNWEMENSGANGGRPTGFFQMDKSGNMNMVPYQRIMHSANGAVDGNPEGRSALIGASEAWSASMKTTYIMNVGIERNLLGIPVGRLPQEFMRKGATQDQKELVGYVKKLVTQLKKNHQTGLILPSDTDEKGNRLIDMELMSGPEPDTEGTLAAIDYHDSKVLNALSSSFIATGDRNEDLDEVRASMYFRACDNVLDDVAAALNKEISKLMLLNGFKLKYTPRFKFSSLDKSVAFGALSNVVNAALTSGALTPTVKLNDFMENLVGMGADGHNPTFYSDLFQEIPVVYNQFTSEMEDEQSELEELILINEILGVQGGYEELDSGESENDESEEDPENDEESEPESGDDPSDEDEEDAPV